MNRVSVFVLLVITLILAMLLALLGVETLANNPLGWFLLLLGVIVTAWVGIVYFIRKERFWELILEGITAHEEHSNRSIWFILLAMIAVFFLSPVEYLNLTAILPRNSWISFIGLGLVILGIMLRVWARHTLQKYSGNSFVKSGPYHFIRHPSYAGYLLIAFGVGLGYSSLAGIASVFALLIPGLIYQMKVEEKSLSDRFGADYHQYLRETKSLIPGLW